jgi:Tfp pilus assembly protein PilO
VSARLLAVLSKLSPGASWLLVLSIGGALLVEGWILVLQQPFAAYRDLSAARQSLREIEDLTMAQQEELRRAGERTKQLADRLNAELAAPASEEQLTVSLMRRLDQAAAREGIQLTSLKPASRRHVLAFEELSFDVGAQGRYLALCQWLLNFEQSLGRYATVTDFTMKSADGRRQVALSLRLALYRPLPAGAEAK